MASKAKADSASRLAHRDATARAEARIEEGPAFNTRDGPSGSSRSLARASSPPSRLPGASSSPRRTGLAMTDRVLYLEPVGGIAGDMFLAAALDSRSPTRGARSTAEDARPRGLALRGLAGDSARHRRHSGERGAEAALARATLALAREHALARGPLTRTRSTRTRTSACHSHEEHSHAPHTSWREIDALIRDSRLSQRTKANASRVFRLLGEAEAKVHGVSLDEIHFHEVGAVDSIIDICGAAVALELLGSPRVLSSPPPLGSGMARISHGVVPVPVPATLELLREIPVRFEGTGELTTPTGAALLKAFATVGRVPELVVERIGYGIGTKDWPDRANVLRASLATV